MLGNASLPTPRPETRETRTVHELKTWPAYFHALISGDKTFELRRNDRDFMPGNMLRLREWCPDKRDYTGRECECIVTYVLRHSTVGGLDPDFVILGIVDPALSVLLGRARAGETQEPHGRALRAISDERTRQDAQWGGHAHDDTHSPEDWIDFIEKQVELARELIGNGTDAELQSRLVKIAALAVASYEAIDRYHGVNEALAHSREAKEPKNGDL
jgi:hypothetical protein